MGFFEGKVNDVCFNWMKKGMIECIYGCMLFIWRGMVEVWIGIEEMMMFF